MQILDLSLTNENRLRQVTTIFYQSFKEMWPQICPNLEAARKEVERCVNPQNINRIAINETNDVLGWVGAVRDYDGHAWCLYPMAVHPKFRTQGIGRALVTDLENLVRDQGAATLYLGTDDTLGMTSIGNKELYPNVLAHISTIQNLRRHPYEFYQKLGFTIVGVIPHANGWGKPDIFMAKQLR
jgi:aminoglycoside 6'-N-acetyltransferase I